MAKRTKSSYIRQAVEHNGGVVECARKLALAHQQVSRWVAQGFAATDHILALEPILPPGMTVRDLLLDRRDRRRRR